MSDWHDQPARCNSSRVCHHCLTQIPTQLPPREKMSQAQDREHGKMMLALLKSTASPLPQNSKPKPQEPAQNGQTSFWGCPRRNPNSARACMGLSFSSAQAGPVQTCQYQTKSCGKEQSWVAKEGTPPLNTLLLCCKEAPTGTMRNNSTLEVPDFAMRITKKQIWEWLGTNLSVWDHWQATNP